MVIAKKWPSNRGPRCAIKPQCDSPWVGRPDAASAFGLGRGESDSQFPRYMDRAGNVTPNLYLPDDCLDSCRAGGRRYVDRTVALQRE